MFFLIPVKACVSECYYNFFALFIYMQNYTFIASFKRHSGNKYKRSTIFVSCY